MYCDLSESNYFDESLSYPMMPNFWLRKNETKKSWTNIMKSITFEGEEGFFLSLKEHKQIQDFLVSAEEMVIQDANNS